MVPPAQGTPTSSCPPRTPPAGGWDKPRPSRWLGVALTQPRPYGQSWCLVFCTEGLVLSNRQQCVLSGHPHIQAAAAVPPALAKCAGLSVSRHLPASSLSNMHMGSQNELSSAWNPLSLPRN